MKNVRIIGWGMALLMILVLFQPFSYASHINFGVSDHSAWAKAYGEKAADQADIIAEHEKIKKDARLMYAPGLQQGERLAMKKYGEIESHCDAIIRDAQRLQNDFLEFAKWHRMQTAESEGRIAQ